MHQINQSTTIFFFFKRVFFAFCSSDSDSDPDGFYGTIETPMELKHPVDSTEDGEN